MLRWLKNLFRPKLRTYPHNRYVAGPGTKLTNWSPSLDMFSSGGDPPVKAGIWPPGIIVTGEPMSFRLVPHEP